MDDAPVTVAGVDGCRAGWLVVRATADPFSIRTVTVEADLVDLLREVDVGDVGVVAVDMPIGLPEGGPRACDIQARTHLGPRRSSVFPAPVRAVIGSHDFDDALRRSRAASGVGLSLQSWHLLPKIVELDDALADLRPEVAARVHETHPEIGFAFLGGGPMPDAKRAPVGRRERVALLRGLVPPRWLRTAAVPRGAAGDDVLDALVLAVRAAQWVDGSGPPVVLGDGTRDARGHPMEIRG